MIDATLLVTLAVLLGGALIRGFLKGRDKDRCLQDLHGYQVTLFKISGCPSRKMLRAPVSGAAWTPGIRAKRPRDGASSGGPSYPES